MHQTQKPALSRSTTMPPTRPRSTQLSLKSACPCKPRRTNSVQCFGLGAMASDAVNTASTVGTAVGVLLSAAFVAREILLEQEADQTINAESQPCPNCHGRGLEPCICTRWSDSDIGCSSCCQTGMMKCRACRGGGTAVPIAVTVRKQ